MNKKGSNRMIGEGRRRCVFIGAAIMGASTCLAQIPPSNQPDLPVDTSTKVEVIRLLASDIENSYVFPDVAVKLAKMLNGHQAHGDYATITSSKAFSELLSQQMRDVAHDAHLNVFYSAKALAPTPELPADGVLRMPPPTPGFLRQLAQDNYGFSAIEHLDGNIGYLKITGFRDAGLAGETLAAAMAFVANTSGLIIDLRQNTGGAPTSVALLASYLLDGNTVHLNDLEFRKPGTREYSVQQFWTQAYVPGKRYVDKEVYILTSARTPSAAEEFTYDMQVLKRATVVGETTWGGANPGGGRRLTEHFSAFIPVGRAINPITNTNWEGKGVEPDIKVRQADALKTAYKMALQHLIEKTKDASDLEVLKRAQANIDDAAAAPGER
jgi:retinol-binding protein 3